MTNWNKLALSLVIGLTVVCVKGQFFSSTCSSEDQRNGDSCQIRIELMADILKDHYSGQSDLATFCRTEFENCVQTVERSTSLKCPGVNATDLDHHARVNAMRGFCADIQYWQQYKSCVQSQLSQGLKVCQEDFFRDKANYTRTQYNKGIYGSEFERRNAFCRLIRGNQECNERVIYANCRDYIDYFREFQVALLRPYCRQLYNIGSTYVTDDPNRGNSITSSFLIPFGLLNAVFIFYWLM